MRPSEAAPAEPSGACDRAGGPVLAPAFHLLWRAALIVALACFLGYVHSTRVPIQLQLAEPSTPESRGVPAPSVGSESSGPSAISSPPIDDAAASLGVRITLAQARSLYDAGTADFIDAREPFEFAPGHIPGAYNLTQADFMGGKTPEALEFLDPGRRVVIYCGGGECHASENVAILLQQAGFSTIHIMEAGFPVWVEAGYEVEASAADEPEGNG